MDRSLTEFKHVFTCVFIERYIATSECEWVMCMWAIIRKVYSLPRLINSISLTVELCFPIERNGKHFRNCCIVKYKIDFMLFSFA